VTDPAETKARSFGADLTAITMGIDSFERANSQGSGMLDSEGLVPIYVGGDLVAPRHYTAWNEIARDLEGLEACLPEIRPYHRRLFAEAMLRSLRAATHLFAGGTASYETKIRDLVGAPTGAVDPAVIEGLRDALDVLLRRQGVVRGDLPARIAAWEEQHFLPAEQLERVYLELMDQARALTAKMIFDCGDYTMALNPVRDVPYSARCSFGEGKMDLNVDLGITRAGMKHLVAHEVFPGHATQILYTRARVEEGRAQPEVLLCTANSVLGCVQEGIGDEAVDLIDWAEDDDDAIHLELRRLRSAAQTSAAWFLMHENRPRAAVADYLRETAAGQDAWVEGRLRMSAHPFRGPFIASYWAGAVAVRDVRLRTAAEDRAAFIEYLYANAHSPESLALFDPAHTGQAA
jgi:hypothetical protein